MRKENFTMIPLTAFTIIYPDWENKSSYRFLQSLMTYLTASINVALMIIWGEVLLSLNFAFLKRQRKEEQV